jgi:hypothetical protein
MLTLDKVDKYEPITAGKERYIGSDYAIAFGWRDGTQTRRYWLQLGKIWAEEDENPIDPETLPEEFWVAVSKAGKRNLLAAGATKAFMERAGYEDVKPDVELTPVDEPLPEQDEPTREEIFIALDRLDHTDDGDWTQGGLPNLTVLANYLNGRYVTRARLNSEFPDLRRSTLE